MWHGSRVNTTFTLLPREQPPLPGQVYREELAVSIIEGEGRRGSRIAAVAKRAGIPSSGYVVPFSVMPSSTMPPPPPRNVTFHERSQYDFTVTWRAPELTPINSEPVVKYALELSVCGASGT